MITKNRKRIMAFVLAVILSIPGVSIGQVQAADTTITVGASECDYSTINEALEAVRKMSRGSSERVVIEIQPGNYEEMLVIDEPNITLKNASSNPSIELKNEGVDIDANAVRITGYYGHGYSYYSMGSDYKWDADVLAANKEAGKASVTNPGAGSKTLWNATVEIAADGFRAEGIIFENSFNQYVSAKAAQDVIVKLSGAKEGSTTRADIPEGSTAVQAKAYVERAAALGIKNNVKEAFFDNCAFVGRQDTLYGGRPATAAFYNCDIYGCTDYIFGGMTAVFAKCNLIWNGDENSSAGYITAPQQTETRGYLMYNCHITSTIPGTNTASRYASRPGYFGRPWKADTGEAVFYKTVIDATCDYWADKGKSLILPLGWYNSLGGESALCGEYGTVELAGVNNISGRAAWSTVFSSDKLSDGSTISVSTFLGSWNPFSGKDMSITTDGSEPVVPTSAPGSATEAPTQTPSSGEVTGSEVHNFTDNGKTSSFYTITGNLSTSKGSTSYNGLSLTQCLKMESSTNISFTAAGEGTLTLVFGGSTSASGKSVKLDGTKYTADTNGVVTIPVTAGSHTITKGDSINLFYMSLAYVGTVTPTEAPTATPAPTFAPTAAPATAAPTSAPTAAPTEAPTAVPTEAPTAAPTAAPTEAPTATPTEAPTAVPTEAPTAAPTSAPTQAPAVSGTEVHNFTDNGKTSSFYTITGNLSTSKGSVSYNGLSLTQCLKMESSTNISFTAAGEGTLTFVFGGSTDASGKKVKLDGTKYTVGTDNTIAIPVTAGSHTITKGDSINLFYMSLAYTGAATPTAAPTAAPTEAPTAAPTLAPTAAPTAAPTLAPTAAPTAAPTSAPAATKPATPVLDITGAFGGYSVTFNCETEGATIYYSTTTSNLTTEDASVENGGTILVSKYCSLYVKAYKDGQWSNVTRSIFKVPTVATPTITQSGNEVTITSSTASAIIYYTTDGTEPSITNGTKSYNATATFTAPSGTTVKAIAVKMYYANSGVSTHTVKIAEKPAVPTFEVVGVVGGREVTFTSATEGATIYYSTTTSNLTTENASVENGGSVVFDSYCSVYVKAYKDGQWSNVARLILKIPTVNTPTIVCENGYATIKTTTPSATIYYTTDGTEPSATNGKKAYASGKMYVGKNVTVKAIAVRSCFANSAVAEAVSQ